MMNKVFTVLAYGHGFRLAQEELPALEAKLERASVEDREALLPARAMYLHGALTLPGYAALLWYRLEAREQVEAYYSAAIGAPFVSDGVQVYEVTRWNEYAAERWTDWAESGAVTSDERADEQAEDERADMEA